MAAKGYTTKEEVENFLLITIDDVLIPQFDRWLEAVERIIDRTTRMTFIADETASAKTYSSYKSELLDIDPALSIESVTVGGSVLDPSSYYTYPASGGPITAIGLTGGQWDGFSYVHGPTWYPGTNNVVVTARWGGFEEVPADIKLAATILMAEIIRQGDQSLRTKASESVGRVSVSYATVNQMVSNMPEVNDILDGYKRLSI